MHPYRLEGARSRMLAWLAGGHTVAHQLCQFSGSGEWAVFPGGDKPAGDPPGIALLSQRAQNSREVVFPDIGQPLPGRDTNRWVHPHIQRTVSHKTEATLCIIQLR